MSLRRTPWVLWVLHSLAMHCLLSLNAFLTAFASPGSARGLQSHDYHTQKQYKPAHRSRSYLPFSKHPQTFVRSGFERSGFEYIFLPILPLRLHYQEFHSNLWRSYTSKRSRPTSRRPLGHIFIPKLRTLELIVQSDDFDPFMYTLAKLYGS